MPALQTKVFNIPFSGGAATVVVLIKYRDTSVGTAEKYAASIRLYSADGTTTDYGSTAADISPDFSVSDGIMTVTLMAMRPYTILDCRCCLIPGDPFA